MTKRELFILTIGIFFVLSAWPMIDGTEHTRQAEEGSLDYYYENGMGRNIFWLYSYHKDLKRWHLSDHKTTGGKNFNMADLNSSFDSPASALMYNFPWKQTEQNMHPMYDEGLTAQFDNSITPYANLTINTNYEAGKEVHFEIRFDTNGDGSYETKALFDSYTTLNDYQETGEWMEEKIKFYSTGYSNGAPGDMTNGKIQLAFWRTDNVIDQPGNANDEDWLTIYCGAFEPPKLSWLVLPYKYPDLEPEPRIDPDPDQDPTDWWVEPPEDPDSIHYNGYVTNYSLELSAEGSSSPYDAEIVTGAWQIWSDTDGDGMYLNDHEEASLNGITVHYTFDRPAVYYIELKVWDENGRSGWTDHWINVTQDPGRIPVIDLFEIDPNPALVNTAVHFTAHADDEDGHATLPTYRLYYKWDFNGDGVWDTNATEEAETRHTYDLPGEYDVSVKVFDGPEDHNDTLWNISTKSLTIKKNDGPVVNFTVSSIFDNAHYPEDDDILVRIGEDITLDLTSCSDPDNLPGFTIDKIRHNIKTEVDFRDGFGAITRYDDDAVYKYNYTKAGKNNKHSISIKVSDGGITEEILFYVLIDVPPKAEAGPDIGTEILGTPGEKTTNDTIEFDGSDSYDPNDDTNGDGKIGAGETDNCTYKWDFGDNTTSDISEYPFAEHRYEEPGEYLVTLTVTDHPRGQSSTDTLTVIILSPNEPPVAIIEIEGGINTFDTTEDIDFNGKNSYDPDRETSGGVRKYYWNFGDGNNSTAVNPTHRYTDDGNYTVRLYVEDERGGVSEVTTKEVTIKNQKPVARIRNITKGGKELESFNIGEPYTFNSESSDIDGRIVSYRWDIGDGWEEWTNKSEIIHTFEKAGEYKVKLQVKDDDQAVSEITIYVMNVPKEYEDGPGFEAGIAISVVAFLTILLWRRRDE